MGDVAEEDVPGFRFGLVDRTGVGGLVDGFGVRRTRQASTGRPAEQKINRYRTRAHRRRVCTVERPKKRGIGLARSLIRQIREEIRRCPNLKMLHDAVIKVIGVEKSGGGKCARTMIDSGPGRGFTRREHRSQALCGVRPLSKDSVGKQPGPRGLAQARTPRSGAMPRLEDRDRIGEAIGEADMVFITAGMGGGTGTGAAPVIAEVARQRGAPHGGRGDRPAFEGRRRQRQAEKALASSVRSSIR